MSVLLRSQSRIDIDPNLSPFPADSHHFYIRLLCLLAFFSVSVFGASRPRFTRTFGSPLSALLLLQSRIGIVSNVAPFSGDSFHRRIRPRCPADPFLGGLSFRSCVTNQHTLGPPSCTLLLSKYRVEFNPILSPLFADSHHRQFVSGALPATSLATRPSGSVPPICTRLVLFYLLFYSHNHAVT